MKGYLTNEGTIALAFRKQDFFPVCFLEIKRVLSI